MILNMATVGIVVFDPEYNIIDVNPSILEKTGHTADELMGKKCYEVFHGNPEPCTDVLCTIKEIMEKGEVARNIHTHRTKDGGVWNAEVSGAPMKDEEGNIIGVIELNWEVSL